MTKAPVQVSKHATPGAGAPLSQRTGVDAKVREDMANPATPTKSEKKGKTFKAIAKTVEAFQYNPNNMSGRPDWVDPNWVGFDGGPVFRVPNTVVGLDPAFAGTTSAKPGDFIVRREHEDRPDSFEVIPREKFLEQYDAKDEYEMADSDAMKKAIRPAQESNAPISNNPASKAAAAKEALSQGTSSDMELAQKVADDPEEAHKQDATKGVTATGGDSPNR